MGRTALAAAAETEGVGTPEGTGTATPENADGTATNTPRPTATRTATPMPGTTPPPTPPPPATPEPPPTQPPPATPTTPPPPTATPTPLPLVGIIAGDWFYSFTVIENTCPFGAFVGDIVDLSFELSEAVPLDDFIEVGELVDIVQIESGLQVGRYNFQYPEFDWTYPIFAAGNPGIAEVFNDYFDDDTGASFLTELYELPTGAECTIVGRD